MTSVHFLDMPGDSDDDISTGQYQQYEQTLKDEIPTQFLKVIGNMYGRYTADLSDYAKDEARKIKRTEKDYRKVDADLRSNQFPFQCQRFTSFLKVWKHMFSRIGEDWIFLAVLGIIMACISFLMDRGIGICNKARIWLYRDLAGSNVFLQYLSWIFLPICLILFSASFVHLTAPQSVGSGIPEMKTIMRGVVLKEYLTFKTLIAKIIGLTATLGTGLPLGKEGPFVHIASMVATLLSKAVTSFKGIYQNESRNSEMLAAACAVGVACSFAAPIGGVLFSIEVTTVYFAVRNYWRGFFAAVCGAMMFRLLAVWSNDIETLTALFETSFMNNPYTSLELFAFAFVGVICGLLGAFFVWVHRQYVIFMRKNKKMKTFLQKSRLLYPLIVTLVSCTLNFPPGFGMFVAGELTTHEQVVELFSNVTWTKDDPMVDEFKIIENWRSPYTNIFVNLIFYFILTFTGCVVASTLPVPSGIFIPVFKMGASLGRLVGEIMGVMFPTVIRYSGALHGIVPGGYSIVGAAAFSGAVTHTISTSVIVFELTGQITHIIPVMLATLIANGIAQLLQPSIYDSIIQIKKLPYLPDIITSTAGAYKVFVEDFMVRDVKYIWYGITYRELKKILLENRKIRSLPLVDTAESMVLLGSIQRAELIAVLQHQVGRDRRSTIRKRWKLAADKARILSNHPIESRLAEKVKKIDPEPTLPKKKGFTFEAFELPFLNHNKFENHTEEINQEDYFNPEPTKPLVANHKPDWVVPRITTSHSSETSLPCPLPEDSDFEVPKRRPSRFEVTKVENALKSESTVTLQVDPVEIPPYLSNHSLQRDTLPRKSILKKTRSFTLHPSLESPETNPQPTHYMTVHAGDSKLRQVIEALLSKRSLTSKLESLSMPKLSMGGIPSNLSNFPSVDSEALWERTKALKREWEEKELDEKLDFEKVQIDPAPFQLVERTSLLKVHSLFSMLSLNHAYVTAIGRLIGVVALKELRGAIEDANLGEIPRTEGSSSELNAAGDSETSSLKANPAS